VHAASRTDTAHITASWRSTGSAGSTNCGRNAVKNAIVFGLDSATAKPRQKCTCPRGTLAVPVSPAWRQAWMPSQTR
jgi:hypothetical protein